MVTEPTALVVEAPDGAAVNAPFQTLFPQVPLPQPTPVKNSSSIVTEPIEVEELTPDTVSILPNAILLEPTAEVVDKLATVKGSTAIPAVTAPTELVLETPVTVIVQVPDTVAVPAEAVLETPVAAWFTSDC